MVKTNFIRYVAVAFILVFACSLIAAQPSSTSQDKALSVISRAVGSMGGDRYLNVKSQVGRGKYSQLRDGAVIQFQSFTDVIVFPSKERTEFKGGGSRTVQTNVGNTGWIYDGDQELVKVQTDKQVADFKQGLRSSLDHLLRGYWKDDAELAYVGRRPSTLGKRNDVIKLTYKDGFVVEFEFAADDGMPQKAIYKRVSQDEETKEEDRYAQFLDFGGIKAAFVIDRFSDGKQSSRINYESMEFNKNVPDSVFAKPASAKDAKKDLKL